MSELFIRRPIATLLLTIGLLLSGILAFRALPVAALPQVEMPTLVVSTFLPGASAQTMAENVTAPLERQLGQVPSLQSMTSLSSEGSSQITLVFSLDRSLDSAVQDVQSALTAASNVLPATLPAPPTYSKQNPADAPVLTLAVNSELLPLTAVHDYADSVLAQRISQIGGVGLVTLGGSQKPAVRIDASIEQLVARGMTLEDLRAALVAANVNQPKGSLEGSRRSYTLATNDQLQGAAAYREVIVAYRGGAAVRVLDVADAHDGVENARLSAFVARAEAPEPTRALLLYVHRQPGANVIEVADKVKELLASSQASMPQGLAVQVLSDRTDSVRASVEDVEFTLVLTVLLVVAVMYLFLRSLRATVIPGVAVPLSLIGTFGAMYLLGYSLNNLSLMALTIATGFVVDDAIVMVENVARHLEHGKKPLEAAIDGAKEIGFTIVSLTVSLVAVLIPLLFMTGVVGRLFREFAVTLAVAIGISAVLSLTLTAMMCAVLLEPEPPLAQQPLPLQWMERGFDWMLHHYARALDWVLRHRRLTLASFAVTLLLTGWLFARIPKGFFPEEDTGLLVGTVEAAPDTAFARLDASAAKLARQLVDDPDVRSVSVRLGADGSNATANVAGLTVVLKAHGERTASAAQIIARLRARLDGEQGLRLDLQSVQDLQLDASSSRGKFQYTLTAPELALLREWAPQFEAALSQRRELQNVSLEGLGTTRGLRVEVDRDLASRLGVSMQSLDDTLYSAFGQRQITTLFTQKNLYRVILEVQAQGRSPAQLLEQLYVRGGGGVHPLSTFVRILQVEAPLQIAHDGQFPAVTLSFDPAPGSALGDAVDVVHEELAKLDMPRAVRGEFHGAAELFRESLAAEPFLVLAALITVYLVLGVLYESFLHPLTILSTLPSAGVGALLALEWVGLEFSIMALIGILLLIGIVKKNAIMMIDFALERQRGAGLPALAAVREACLLRFRPILMTTLAALLGGVPLAFGSGLGSELRRPLGVSIVGGLLLSQLLTLFTTPVIYLALDALGARVRRAPSPKAGAELAP